MPGYSIYILDTHMNPVSPGVPGEIVIGGAGVSPGYLNNESLTADKFLDNPWMSPEFAKNGWTKMYRTGDRGRITPEGQVLFHGRIEGDLQIKLRGFRIELEDIECSILQASEGNFTEVVCSIRGDPEFLVAHAIFAKNFESKGEDGGQFIKNLLAHLPLPSYMVPAAIVPLDAMPLTVHLKRDRAAVAALPISQPAPVEEETSDLDPSELELKAIWMEVLPQEMFNGISSRNSNFFRCGGSSLLMVELQSRIRTTLGVSLSLQELFRTSDLGDMAESIQERMTPTV
jgi:hybrid polyketide synthase/nonribosomal peptide synthetase ACE1